MRRSLVVLAILALAIALLACSNGNAPGVSDSNTQSGNAVSIKDNAVSPVNLQTTSGTTVKFANNDSMSHDMVADDGSFDSGALGEGRAYRFTVSKAGTYKYHCSMHPTLTSEQGTIVVK